MKSNTEKQEFVALRAQGLSLQKISEQINVSKKTLVNWDKLFLEEIDNLKALELECLRESYGLTKRAEVERIGRLLERVMGELETRDLSDVKTERLIELAVKLGDHLRDTAPDPMIRDDHTIQERRDQRAVMASLGMSEGALHSTGTRSSNGAVDVQSLTALRVAVLRRYHAGEIDERTAAREMALINPLFRDAVAARDEAQLERIETIFVPHHRRNTAPEGQNGGERA